VLENCTFGFPNFGFFPRLPKTTTRHTKEKQRKKERRDGFAEVRLEISSSETKYSEIKGSCFWTLKSSNI
jgi:hypothetical protein